MRREAALGAQSGGGASPPPERSERLASPFHNGTRTQQPNRAALSDLGSDVKRVKIRKTLFMNCEEGNVAADN